MTIVNIWQIWSTVVSSTCSSGSGGVFALLMLGSTVEAVASGGLLLCGRPVELGISLGATLDLENNFENTAKFGCSN